MTLTAAAILTKRIIIIFFTLIIIGIIAKVGYDIWYQHYLASLPPVEVKPDLKFGALPDITFPNSNNISSSNFSYSLDTPTGNLPDVAKIIKVYFIPKSQISLLSPDKALQLAQSLGFSSGPETLSSQVEQFQDSSSNTLSVDLLTGNFQFQMSATPSAQTSQSPTPSQDALTAEFKGYLASRSLLTDQLSNGPTNVVFESSGSAKLPLAIVSVWPVKIDQLPIVTADWDQSLVKAVVNLNSPDIQTGKNFTSISYTVWPVDTTTFATYPLKTASQAFLDLRSGRSFVSQPPKEAQVSLTSIYLAYFESADYSPYLLPVFVFQGPDFTALVPAIENENSPSASPTP